MSMGVHREIQDYEKLYYINGGILEIIIILQQWGYIKQYFYTISKGVHKNLQDYLKVYFINGSTQE